MNTYKNRNDKPRVKRLVGHLASAEYVAPDNNKWRHDNSDSELRTSILMLINRMMMMMTTKVELVHQRRGKEWVLVLAREREYSHCATRITLHVQARSANVE
jgi:hypothetical protein